VSSSPDRLYELLPAVYRLRDAELSQPLQALLQVIAEQVDVVEEDISQLYENWFIETCQDWVAPYIGDLIGYRPVHEAGEPGDVGTSQGQQLNKILTPRREVANTVYYRRRKGTLPLLELLANDAAGWPYARAVEFYKLLGLTQAVNHLRPTQGRTADLRQGAVLDLLDSSFDELAHTVDVRRIDSHRSRGRHNIPNLGLFVWRLKSYPVTRTPAYYREEDGPHCYTFSVLGNDGPLYARPDPETEPTRFASESNLPIPIRRRVFKRRKIDYYGIGKSAEIWVEGWRGVEGFESRRLVPPDRIVSADLTGWRYRPRKGQIAVDPERGRIAFHPHQLPQAGVWVSYGYGFSADIGGGEYERSLLQPTEDFALYQVGQRQKGQGQTFERINEALDKWREDEPSHAIIEITDSEVYGEEEKIDDISLGEDQTLQLRAASGARPVIRLLDRRANLPDALRISGGRRSRFTLDGLLIAGRGVRIEGGLTSVTIRHSTLVPGWSLQHDCEPRRPAEPSLQLFNTKDAYVKCVNVEHSIVGSIQSHRDDLRTDPVRIRIFDSILDATDPEWEALGSVDCSVAHARLTAVRSTVIGQVQVHAIDLGENSIFDGRVRVARRQWGCMRFCYIAPDSRTPRRYNCQPDLVEQRVEKDSEKASERDAARQRERERVRPRFNSVRYGTPTYCQLAEACADEIRRGADEESEMGVFHDLFQPQREANLRARLDEYTPAGVDAGIIFAS
jgi:hypothetical protein